MNNDTIGRKIAHFRRTKNMTQDALSEALSVTPQAVSKWENDGACPDIALLVPLAQIFGTSVDELLSNKPLKSTRYIPEGQRKDIDDMLLRIMVLSSDGDKVRINLPMPLIKAGIAMGLQMPQISGNEKLKDIDFKQLFELIEKGAMGNLVEVESADGDIVLIAVE